MRTASGTIIKGIGGFYYVDIGSETVECRARGKFRKTHELPMVGDRVEVEVGEDNTGSVIKILPRRNFLVRPSVANIDVLVAVSAAATPEPDYLLADKLLVVAEHRNIEAIVCINKTDLVSAEETEKFLSVYKRAGYKAIAVCAGDGSGTDELFSLIDGKTAAFAGLSGVGKSSLLSLVTGRDLAVGGVSKIERGKHTTRHVELIPAGGGYIFDTPGFSRLELDDIKAEELRMLFPEMARLEGQCRFRGCNHVAEPGCAVLAAVECGEIAESRHKSYKEIFDVLKNIKEWELK